MTTTTRVTDRTIARMGKRAAAYVADHSITAIGGRVILVADCDETPEGVSRTLTRLFGRPTTVDRGETAYWEICGEDVEVEG